MKLVQDSDTWTCENALFTAQNRRDFRRCHGVAENLISAVNCNELDHWVIRIFHMSTVSYVDGSLTLIPEFVMGSIIRLTAPLRFNSVNDIGHLTPTICRYSYRLC